MAAPAASNAAVISRFYDKVASENLSKATLFGASLNAYMDEQKKKMPFLNVPWIVRKCCDYLHANGALSYAERFALCAIPSQISVALIMNLIVLMPVYPNLALATEGLFRVPGSHNVVAKLQDHFDQGSSQLRVLQF